MLIENLYIRLDLWMMATLKNSANYNQGKCDPIVAKIYNPFAKLCVGRF
jgi:hypothetical protein